MFRQSPLLLGTEASFELLEPSVLQDIQLELKVPHAIIVQAFDDESRGRGEAGPRLPSRSGRKIHP